VASTNGRNLGRGFGELALIIVGVLVALGVDRWIAGFDARELESAYLQQLADNVAADSAALETQLASVSRRMEWADDLFAALDGELPSPEDAGLFLRHLDRMPIWTPFDPAREAWDDLVSTGNLRVIRDLEIRQSLSAYYNGLEREEKQMADMDTQLTAIEMSTWPVLDPSRRLAIVTSTETPVASMDEVRAALSRVRNDRTLHARLVQARLMHEVTARRYGVLLERSSSILKGLPQRTRQEEWDGPLHR
jgi:hypothetical protein